MLRFDGLRAAALRNFFLFISNFAEEVNEAAGIFFKFRRFCIDIRLQQRLWHAVTSQRNHKRVEEFAARTVYEGLQLCAREPGSARDVEGNKLGLECGHGI